MRIYHKVRNEDTGKEEWLVLTSDDDVYVYWLIQVLRLVLGESPFYSTYGIPAVETIATNIYPDYYVALVRDQFSPYFASLTITRVTQERDPIYNVNVLTNNGRQINQIIQGIRNNG
ncbi:hypothetical protein [Commensalibacter nepenthis]|uniref:Uncharacterized protein n=1 Tax=Commensalibacter nepenthis TaxID=3043872 RepID=A0ABT6Q876_9PROT|nr:hypothetical protein [Commensalibacter sp. TBRC 10068]MDI2113089.1 hypothetical protein [Commensalibacter sp. TBRC 10068]